MKQGGRSSESCWQEQKRPWRDRRERPRFRGIEGESRSPRNRSRVGHPSLSAEKIAIVVPSLSDYWLLSVVQTLIYWLFVGQSNESSALLLECYPIALDYVHSVYTSQIILVQLITRDHDLLDSIRGISFSLISTNKIHNRSLSSSMRI